MCNKPIDRLQDTDCPGACKRELYEGDVCRSGTCEYNIHDPFNAAQKAALVQTANGGPLLPPKPIKHVVPMRRAVYRIKR